MSGEGCYGCDERQEGNAVWYIGLAPDGQAHFACEYCAPGLLNVTRLHEFAPSPTAGPDDGQGR